MTILINDADLEQELRAQREAWGADKHDEVWEGVYVMSPAPNDEHQELSGEFYYVLRTVVGRGGKGKVRPGVNITNRREGWRKNFRVPDVAVFLGGTAAENRDTHWVGGPDFGVEIISTGDRTREKVPFYETIGTRELLLVDRDPWALELYRHDGAQLALVGRVTLDKPIPLESQVLPLTFQLRRAEARPEIHIRHRETGQEWAF
jgi:Uma2 family endonuclease